MSFRDWVPREEALALIASSHMLLVLAQEQPDQVPNKVYEYLGSGRPILAYADRDGEVAALLGRLAGHHVATSADTADTEDFLSSSILGAHSVVPVDDPLLVELTTENQMALLARTVRHVAEAPT